MLSRERKSSSFAPSVHPDDLSEISVWPYFCLKHFRGPLVPRVRSTLLSMVYKLLHGPRLPLWLPPVPSVRSLQIPSSSQQSIKLSLLLEPPPVPEHARAILSSSDSLLHIGSSWLECHFFHEVFHEPLLKRTSEQFFQSLSLWPTQSIESVRVSQSY